MLYQKFRSNLFHEQWRLLIDQSAEIPDLSQNECFDKLWLGC